MEWWTSDDNFDEWTGEPVRYRECRNPACYWGCMNTGGHQYRGWFTRKCVKCGEKDFFY